MANNDSGANATITVQALRAQITFKLPPQHAHLAPAVAQMWERCLVEPSVFGVCQRLSAFDEHTDEQDLTRLYGNQIAAASVDQGLHSALGELLLFHAAGLARPDGRVLTLVAASGTGKTTAARALGQHFGYVSDEVVAAELDGTIHAFPKPLQILVDKGAPKHAFGPQELGLQSAGEQLRLGPIILLNRQAGEKPRLERHPYDEALAKIVPQTSSLHRLPQPLRHLCRHFDSCGGVWQLTYGEISDAVDMLREASFAPLEEAPVWEGVPLTDPGSDPLTTTCPQTPVNSETPVTAGFATSPQPESAATWQRADVLDAIRYGDTTSVLLGQRFIVLQGPGQVVWELTDSPRQFGDIQVALVKAFGPHQQAEHITGEILGTMVNEGLLQGPLMPAVPLSGT